MSREDSAFSACSQPVVRLVSLVILVVVPLAPGCRHGADIAFLSADPDAEAKGTYHIVKAGETLQSICASYGADLQEVTEINGIGESAAIKTGEKLFIPDVESPEAGSPRSSANPIRRRKLSPPPVASPKTSTNKNSEYIWPIQGMVTSQFGVRAGRRHDGVDIAAPAGTLIHASADGSVLFAGNQGGGYGNLVILQHKNRFITVYAHNSETIVKEGQAVKKGAPIAKVGQTGRASGPHVHFEIREGTTPRNPLFFLPRPD